MKIALLTISFWPKRGGMQFAVHDLATALHDLGHDVFVFAPRVRKNYEEIDHRYSLVRFGWRIPPTNRFGLGRLALRWAFWRLHCAQPFAVINAHSAYGATTLADDLKRCFGVPVVVTPHGQDVQRFPEVGYGYRLDPAKDRVIRRHLRQADRVISSSDSVYADLVEVVSKERIVRIPNGVNLGLFTQSRSDFLRRRLEVQTGKIILSVGRNIPGKGFDVGLRAFALVAERCSEVHYVHIGSGGEPLQMLSEDLGIAHRFHALGELDRDEVFLAYQGADVFLTPSTIESFGLVTIEAMASGLPCVVADGPGNRELILHGTSGWIVPVGDVEAMAEALLDLLQNEERGRVFAEASRELATQYDWRNVAQAYVRAFESVIAAGREQRKS